MSQAATIPEPTAPDPHSQIWPGSPGGDPTPQPFSALDHNLFEAFLAHGLSRPHLAAAINAPSLSSLETLAWLNQPHIAAARAQSHAAAAESAALRHASACFVAIETLERTCRT